MQPCRLATATSGRSSSRSSSSSSLSSFPSLQPLLVFAAALPWAPNALLHDVNITVVEGQLSACLDEAVSVEAQRSRSVGLR
jgi:hypothetical protein